MRKVRLNTEDTWNMGSVFDDLSSGVAVAILVFMLVLVTSPLAGISVFFAEWMLVLLLIPIGVAYRIVFRRPWHVYAESVDGRDAYATSVIGWPESQQVIELAADEIRTTGAPRSYHWAAVQPRRDA
jgi:hypothetical protein